MLLFLYVTEEAGRKYVRDMPWPPAAECNMITNKQIYCRIRLIIFCRCWKTDVNPIAVARVMTNKPIANATYIHIAGGGLRPLAFMLKREAAKLNDDQP